MPAPDSPDFDANLRSSLQRETEMVFRTIVQEDRSVVDLLDSDFTFVDERLARHYGIPGVLGSRMRRISLPEDSPRRGLLGQGSILTLTSAANRIAAGRSRQVDSRECARGATAAATARCRDQPGKGSRASEGNLLRQRLELHRASPTCAACHRLIDPVGLALENFDNTGKWRTMDGKTPIDASSQMADGTKINGPESLRALLARSDVFVTVMAEKLLTYATGRAMRPEDMPAVRGIAGAMAQSGNRFSSMVLGVVRTPQFQMRTKTGS